MIVVRVGSVIFFFFQAEDGIRDRNVTGVQTCALPICTDMAREYKKLSKEHGQVKEKYSGLVERFNENVNDYNELLEENKSLKSKISDLKRDVSLIYESTKEFLKERTDG